MDLSPHRSQLLAETYASIDRCLQELAKDLEALD